MEKTSDMPLVSIIVPVYNVENYIEKCLESVRNQSYTMFECLIVNDGSKDRSIEIAEKFETEDNRFRILHKENGGLASARNYGMKHSEGEYISFLDADDFWKAHKIEQQLIIFSNNLEADLVYSNCEIFDGVKTYTYSGPSYSGDPLELLYANTIVGSGSSVIIKRLVYEKIGGFNENLKSFEDLEYWFRAAINRFKFYFLKEIGVTIYKRDTSLSHNKSNMMQANLASYKVQLEELENMDFPLTRIHNASLKRINKSRKYFTVKSYISNYLHISALIIAYIKHVLRVKL